MGDEGKQRKTGGAIAPPVFDLNGYAVQSPFNKAC